MGFALKNSNHVDHPYTAKDLWKLLYFIFCAIGWISFRGKQNSQWEISCFSFVFFSSNNALQLVPKTIRELIKVGVGVWYPTLLDLLISFDILSTYTLQKREIKKPKKLEFFINNTHFIDSFISDIQQKAVLLLVTSNLFCPYGNNLDSWFFILQKQFLQTFRRSLHRSPKIIRRDFIM